MKIRFNHIGVAVSEPDAFKKVADLLGLTLSSSETVETEKVNVHFYPMGAMSSAVAGNIEILEATDPESPIQKFLDKKGPGIHHLCLEVDDIESLSSTLRENGIRLVYDETRIGAHEMKVNFIHPKSTGGILMEISEKPGK